MAHGVRGGYSTVASAASDRRGLLLFPLRGRSLSPKAGITLNVKVTQVVVRRLWFTELAARQVQYPRRRCSPGSSQGLPECVILAVLERDKSLY